MASGPVVGYVSPFIPPEWLSASGAEAVRLEPHAAGPDAQALPGVCPYVRSLEHAVHSRVDLDLLVLTTTCDQMRRAAERVASDGDTDVFLMNVPATWRTTNALKLYDAELDRLAAAIVRRGGVRPSNGRLAEEMVRYEAERQRAAVPGLLLPEEARGAIPLAVVGGPLSGLDRAVLLMITRAGGRVVLDGTDEGERALPARFDRRRLHDEARSVLVESYFGTIPDAFRRDDQLLYDWIRTVVGGSGARGVIVLRYVWCDMWAAHAERIKEATGLPVLELDLTADGTQATRLAGRIEAFVEMLQ